MNCFFYCKTLDFFIARCTDQADIVLVLDSSSSIGVTNFQTMRIFLDNLINRFNVGPNAALVSWQFLNQVSTNRNCVELHSRGDGCLVSIRASVIRSNISRVPSASASCQACPAQNFHSFSWYSLVRCHSLQQRGQRVVEFEWLQQQSRRAASCHPDTVRRVRNTDRQRHQLHA